MSRRPIGISPGEGWMVWASLEVMAARGSCLTAFLSMVAVASCERYASSKKELTQKRTPRSGSV